MERAMKDRNPGLPAKPETEHKVSLVTCNLIREMLSITGDRRPSATAALSSARCNM